MKKLLLFLAFIMGLQGGAKASVYVQVTDISDITDGKYLMVAYHPSWTDPNHIIYLTSSNTIQGVAISDITTDGITSAGISESQAVWTLAAQSSATTCPYHTSYTVFNANVNGAFFQGHTSSASTTGTEDAALFHFTPLTGTYAGYFNIHYNLSSSTKYAWSINSANAIGWGTKNDATTIDLYSDYTWLVGVYKQMSDEDAFAAYKANSVTSLENYQQNYSQVDLSSYITEATELQFSNTYAESCSASDAITEKAYKAIADFYSPKYTGAYVTIQARGNKCYLKNDGTNVTNDATKDPYAIWKIVDSTWNNGHFEIKLYSPTYQTYLGSLDSFATNTVIPVTSSENDAVAYGALPAPTNGYFALSTTKFSTSTNCIHINNGVQSITGKSCYWSYEQSDNSQWSITLISDDEVRQMLKDDVASFDGGLNHYTSSIDVSEYNNAMESAAEDESKGIEDLCQVYHTNHAAAHSGTSTLVMPQSGRYLRIYTAPGWCAANSWSTTPYLSSTNYDDTHAKYVTDKDETTIMYYTGERLLAYATGRYAKGSTMLYFTTDTEGASANSGVTVAFEEGSNESGTYFVHYAGATRYMYTGTDLYTNGGSSTDASGGYNFQLEYVDELPVTIGENGSATFCVPVPVKIPENSDCAFFTAKLSGTDIVITPVNAGDELAAQTPIFISAAAGTKINMPVEYDYEGNNTSSGTGASFYANEAWQSYIAQDGYVTYIPSALPTESTETESSQSSAAPAILRAATSDSSSKVAFAQATDTDALPVNVPILNVDKSTLGVNEAVESFTIDLGITEEDTFSLVSVVTSIEEINADAAAEQQIYDLQGRRVNGNPTHGIFIFGNKIRRI